MIRKQFTLYLENRAGALAKATRILALMKINIEGISVSESTDVGLVQIVVNDAVATRKALSKARIPYTIQDVAMLTLRNEPGALHKIVSRLAKAGVNINYIYGTNCNYGADGIVIVSAPDLKKLETTWKAIS